MSYNKEAKPKQANSPSSFKPSRPARRRKPSIKQAKIKNDQTSKDKPNLSPQYDPRILKLIGRDGLPEFKNSKNDTTKGALKLIPLGGLCEIGKNMTVYEYGNDMIIVDVGVAFPDENQPGIDSVIPDMSYVLENKHKLRGIFFTHGHEDHIGSISWLISQVSVPLYGTTMTGELLRLKLTDKGLEEQCRNIKIVKYGEKIKAACFSVEFINVNHSIADAAALAIRMPAGLVIHSGDFKIDYTPVHGEPIDLQRFAELGSEGVLLFVCESTNIEKEGFSPSESTVGQSFVEQFSKAKGRVIVATFSSNIHRLQQIITAAEAHNRKVAITGRSMINVFKAAQNVNYLKMKEDTLIDLRNIEQYPEHEVAIITTGSQGEPMSALTRMAFSEHRNVEIGEGDTIIISATPIPGNEKPIYRVINELYKRQANVVYSALEDIHVSGHGYREEIKILHRLVKPKYFIPAHGEYRHLYMHAQLGHEMGLPMENIYILNNGDIFQCSQKKAGIAGYTKAGAVYIDGLPKAKVDTLMLEERKQMSDFGILSVAVSVDKSGKKLVGSPIVMSKGLTSQDSSEQLEEDVIKRVQNFMRKKLQSSSNSLASPAMKKALEDELRNMIYYQSKRRPMVMLAILEDDFK